MSHFPLWTRVLILWPILIYLVLLAFLTLRQQQMIYPGAGYLAAPLSSPQAHGPSSAQPVPWVDPQGDYIGWKSTMPEAEAIWLVFHGNGDNAQRAIHWALTLRQHIGIPVDIYVLEYPGYGPRPGTPSEASTMAAATDALNQLSPEGKPIFLLGQSLGAAIATQLAALHPDSISGILLANPFDTMESAARQVLHNMFGPLGRLFPASLMLRDRYDSISHIAAYRGPVAAVSVENDPLTPASMAQNLISHAPGTARLWIQPGSGHWTDLTCTETFHAAVLFLIQNATKEP